MYTLDTNALIYYSRNEPAAVDFLERIFQRGIAVYISTVTEVEFLSFPELTPEEVKKIEVGLSPIIAISLDSRIAHIAGRIRRTYKLKLADSIIAATALFTNSILVTRNTRDFKKIPDLRVQKI